MKLALGLEYDGTNYHGWQKQKHSISIQECLEKALSKIANEPISIYCAGRTDTGVHAVNQVVHFYTKSYRKIKSWILGLNSNLPKDIYVKWIIYVKESFHARFSAISRCYKYIIYNNTYNSVFLNKKVFYISKKLDIDKMKYAGKYLLGTHNFKLLISTKCQTNNYIRTIYKFKIYKKNNFILIKIKANSFLYKMVRNIVGCLIEIGLGKKSKKLIYNLLIQKKKSFNIAPPKGLYLYKINYPYYFYLPI
ncbi:tRNA pseudouridine(38-40) synthase TruA [Sodalis-like secondary symbiont of Drepanosiphum platanoidis]|uniref:tRNA pseudouridine(38-40) synthase TruA n=1 Tax=Sodalis-like secondary symbiont of Drepanosiphum platanoidis TaxID=2994493 RepID=UPI003464E4ED